MKSEPKITVIIPVKNNEKTLERCLKSVFAVDWRDFEVIAINDGSTDSTGKILENAAAAHKNLKIITTGGVGPSNARNLAIRESSGEFIASTDGDCIVEKNWLRELHSGFNDEKIAGVGGDQLSPPDDTPFAKSVSGFLKSVGFITDYVKPSPEEGGRENGDKKDATRELEPVEHNPTCNVMYRKKVFDELGGFYSGLWPGEDVEFDRRLTKAGYRHLYNHRARVYHYRPRNLKAFSRMMYSYGRVQSWLLRKFGPFRKIHFVPPVFLILIVAWTILAVRSPEVASIILLVLINGTVLFFLKSAGNLQAALKFFYLFVVTVFNWNKGFFADFLGFDRRLK